VRRAAGAVLALILLTAAARPGAAQDTTAVVRHVLPLDVSKVQPFRRTYDMIVQSRDSTMTIGQREVALGSAAYAGAPAWLVIETRTGLVPAIESLYVSADMRPLHWSSVLGAARLGVEFVGDTIFGATTAPGGRRNIVLGGRPDLIVSTPMVEALLPLLPLSAQWTDSVGVLAVDVASSAVIAAELAVIGEEELQIDSASVRPYWIVALRAETSNVLFWVDKETGAVQRVQQPLPAHVGMLLEYRMRRDSAQASPER
jgi:hypothetical protein